MIPAKCYAFESERRSEGADESRHIGDVVVHSKWPTARIDGEGRDLSIEPLIAIPTHKNSHRNRSECDGYLMVGGLRFGAFSLSLGVVLILIANY